MAAMPRFSTSSRSSLKKMPRTIAVEGRSRRRCSRPSWDIELDRSITVGIASVWYIMRIPRSRAMGPNGPRSTALLERAEHRAELLETLVDAGGVRFLGYFRDARADPLGELLPEQVSLLERGSRALHVRELRFGVGSVVRRLHESQ